MQEAPEPGRAVDEAAAREREHAARLLGFLRDLARARHRPSRDLAGHDHVHWLADLPGDVYVEVDAGPGDVLFSVPVIPLTPPVVLDEFDGWLALRNWYRILRELAGQEVVLATGLLTWRPAVHDHLLSTPVRIAVDDRTDRIDVVLTGHTTLRDRELLSGHPGFRPAGRIADAVRAGHAFGLNASAGEVLRHWCRAALTVPAGYGDDWTPEDAEPQPRVRLAPALVVRPPGRATVADHHARLLGLLPRGVPEGLARLVAPAGRPQVMHVPERTPQTVPDLLTGLLARGHRVLVATSGPAASAALRAALPPGLTALTALDPATAAQATAALGAAGAGPGLDEATARERAAGDRVAEILERLDGDGEPAPDLRAREPGLSWMPVRPDLPPTPPISRSEAAELAALLAEETTERKARTRQRDVDPGALPSAAYVRTLIEAEAAAAERAERSRTDLSQRLRDLDVTLLARLDGDASVVAAALRDLGLDGHPGGWNPADLAVGAFADALAERRPLIWSRVAEMASRARWAEEALAVLGGHRVELPPDADLRGLAASAEDLRAHLAGGGALKRGPLRPAVQRQAEPLLATATVDGAAPTTPELLDLVHTELMVRITCRELQYVWEAAGISFPADLPPAERVARFVRAHVRLARVHDVLPAVESTRTLLERAGITVPLGHPLQWHGYVTALRNALEGLGVHRAAADLDALRDSIGPPGDDDPPELRAALAAIDARDAAAYGRALGALAEARHERTLQTRCEHLLARVRAVHPDLANLMVATDGDEVWHDRTARWDDAWTWARRAAAASGPSREERLRADLAAAESDLDEARAQVAIARAWTSARTRPDTVPAWIVPLWRIPDVVPPDPDSFDVVIVDGEHEAGAEALHILWQAPRTILVGPPGPELPPPADPPPSLRLPPHLAIRITPTTPLFTALTTPSPPSGPPPSGPGLSRDGAGVPSRGRRASGGGPPNHLPPSSGPCPTEGAHQGRADDPTVTRHDLGLSIGREQAPSLSGEGKTADRSGTRHDSGPGRAGAQRGAPGREPAYPRQENGSGRGARGVPPRRLDAPPLRGAEPEAPRRERGGPPPRRLDAPDLGRAVPPRRIEAPRQNPRGAEVEQRPPTGRPDIPALWGRPGPRPSEQKPEPEGRAGEEPEGRAGAQVRRGRSIAAYKRHELVELVGRVAGREPDLTDDQLVELVTRLLGCPEDEALLVGARIRYAVEAYRKPIAE